MNIKVRYYNEDIDSELDKEIEEALGAIGYKCYGTGYHLVENYRELCFEREEA